MKTEEYALLIFLVMVFLVLFIWPMVQDIFEWFQIRRQKKNLRIIELEEEREAFARAHQKAVKTIHEMKAAHTAEARRAERAEANVVHYQKALSRAITQKQNLENSLRKLLAQDLDETPPIPEQGNT